MNNPIIKDQWNGTEGFQKMKYKWIINLFKRGQYMYQAACIRKKAKDNKFQCGVEDGRGLSVLMRTGIVKWESVGTFFQKLKLKLPCDPMISLLSICPNSP